MGFYKVSDNVDTVYASDVDQIVDAFSNANDIGKVELFNPIAPPSSAPAVAVNPTAGNLSGAYKYAVAFVTGYWKGEVVSGTLNTQGNTGGGTSSATVSPSAQQVNLTSIPTGPTGTVARVLYRTKAGGSSYFFLAQINDNTTTSWTDNAADTGLGAQMPTTNTTGSYFAGDAHGLTNLPVATTSIPGAVEVSTAPASGQNPVAVSTTDPVYVNTARKDQPNTFTQNQTVNAILDATTLQQNGVGVQIQGKVAYPGSSADGTDADTYNWQTGWYQVGPYMANMPGTNAYWAVQVITDGGNTAEMIAYDQSSTTHIYFRQKVNGVWDSSWKQLWNSSNDGAGSGLDADLFRGLDALTFNTDGGATQLNSGTDLNTVTTTGFYNGSGLTNAPNGDTTGWYYIEVIRHVNTNGYCLQRATTLNASVDNVYYRLQKGGTWGAWKLMTSNLQTQPVASFSTASTTYVTALSVTGKGRLLGLAGDAYTVSEIIIDGVTIAIPNNTDQTLNTLAFGSNSTGWSPAGMFWDFTSSLQINIHTSSSSYATAITYAYAKEV